VCVFVFVFVFVFGSLYDSYPSINTMIRRSPACSRKKIIKVLHELRRKDGEAYSEVATKYLC
jgi:hypothetical protein